MRRRPLLASLFPALSLIAVPGHAETPAEQASRQLQQGIREDRAAEAGGPDAPRPPTSTPTTSAIEADRRSIQPDVGRPGGGRRADHRWRARRDRRRPQPATLNAGRYVLSSGRPRREAFGASQAWASQAWASQP